MNLKRTGFALLLAFLFTFTAPAVAGTALPFGVTLGGQKAVLASPAAAFAKVPDPVAADAELVVDTKEAMTIINIFDCDAQGNVASSAVASVLILQGTNKGKINKVMTGKPPKTGNHIMNITAGAATARVFFKVQ